MPIRAIAFDIGGVLEYTPRTGWNTEWEQRLGLSPGGLAAQLGEIWQAGSLGTRSLAEVEAEIGRILGIDAATVTAMMNDSWHEYVGTLNTELMTYFTNLRPRYTTGIISNSFVGAREREYELYRFAEACDQIIYSHEVGLAKPDPRIYELACAQFGVAPRELLFLDDVPENIEAARALNIHAVLFHTNTQAISEIEQALASEPAE